MLILLLISSNGFSWASTAAGLDKFTYLPLAAVQPPPTRKINIPDFGADAVADQHFSEMSIFWFGRISPSDNYADVRIGYNNTGLALILSIFDRLLWYDTSPANADLARWDAVTLYLSQNGSLNNAYRFTVQISSDAEQNRTRWQLAERWVSSAWTVQSISFEASTGLRWQDYTSGGLNNNQNNRGWVTAFNIPFTSLGLAGKPPQGAEWKMALALHDRDDANGTVILESSWPENAQFTQPGSWGVCILACRFFSPLQAPRLEPRLFVIRSVVMLSFPMRLWVAQPATFAQAIRIISGRISQTKITALRQTLTSRTRATWQIGLASQNTMSPFP
jgi:hypothetical protein